MTEIASSAPRQMLAMRRPAIGGHILLVLVAFALFSPPFAARSSLRPDAIILYAVLPLLLLWAGEIRIPRRYRIVVFGMLALPASAAIATALQYIAIGPLPSRYWLPAAGLTRAYLSAVLAIVALSGDGQAKRRLAVLLLAGVLAHGCLAAIELLQVYPLADWIGAIYRNTELRPTLRAIGAFGTVHSLAYFVLYGLILSYSMYHLRLVRFLAAAAAISAVGGLLLTFSRSAIVAGVVAGLVFAAALQRFGAVLKIAAGAAVGVGGLVVMLPERWAERFYSTVEDAWQLVHLVSGGGGTASRSAFVAGRVEHGWRHSLQAWAESPWFGNLRAHELHFIGDGGYTTALGEFGLIGLAGMIVGTSCLFAGAWLACDDEERGRVCRAGIAALAAAFFAANVAASGLRERSLELLPVMVILLAAFGMANRRSGEAASGR